MKRMLMLVFILINSLGAYNQDILVLRSGEIVKAKVSEIDLKSIKYKKADNLSGPIYTIPKDSVLSITYENGSKDVFNKLPHPISSGGGKSSTVNRQLKVHQ